MPRALSVQRSVIPAADRERHFERLRTRRAHYRSRQCRYWAFEEAAIPGAFLEFVEADDATLLTAAHASNPELVVDPARIYVEVDLG